MPSRLIDDLTEEMQEKAKAFSVRMQHSGIPFLITQTRRTEAEQIAYYAQGREDINEVNRLRRLVGLRGISKKDNERPVTYTLNSKHLVGRAFDFAIYVKGELSWTTPLYKTAGDIGKTLGLVWGGDWPGKKCDPGHFELPEED